MRKLKLPPLHTSHRPSTVKHVSLCVSSTARETVWLEAHGEPVRETSNHNRSNYGQMKIELITFRFHNIGLELKMYQDRLAEKLTPDCHEHCKRNSAFIVKQVADLDQ